MYEMRQKKIREMQQKNWWSYTLLAAAIFIFTQSCSLISAKPGQSLSVILISLIMHVKSVGDLTKRILKIKESKAANIAMVIALLTVAVICYIKTYSIFIILLFNIAAVFTYVITAAILSMTK